MVAAIVVAILGVVPAFAQPYTFTTLAGVAGAQGGTDGTGPFARFIVPNGVVVAGDGTMYVTDQGACTVRKIAPTGHVTTLAGSAGLCAITDGTGAAARFSQPIGIAVGPGDILYVADYTGHVIRKVTPQGVVTTFAGLAGSPGSTDGTGSDARFRNPVGVAVDGVGTVYVTDQWNFTIRRISPAGVVTTLAGLAGVSGNADGTGSTARFFSLNHATLDGAGTLYVADNCSIRKVTPAGVVTTFAGMVNACGAVDATGTAARFGWPRGVAADTGGTVYVADSGNHTIRVVTPAGVVSTLAGSAGVAGSADGTGSAARFFQPFGIGVGSSGALYVCDSLNFTVRKGATTASAPSFSLQPADQTTFAMGSATLSAWALGIPTPSLQWQVSSDGGVSWADLSNGAPYSGVTTATLTMTAVAQSLDGYQYRSAATNPAGSATSAAATLSVLAPYTFTTLTGSTYGSTNGTGPTARFKMPVGMAVAANGTVYVADYQDHTIRQITPAGVATTLAGLSGVPGSTDGTGAQARFNVPAVLALDGFGNLYVTDQGNHTIRKVTPGGLVSTVAGLAGFPGSTDGTVSEALFNSPTGIAVDAGGTIYLTEDGNHTIRKIAPGGVVTTIAGLAGFQGSADGTGAEARFSFPNGVAVNGTGVLYVTDAGNHTIRKITPAGVVTTLAGVAGAPGSADGTGSAVRFIHPTAVAMHTSGIMYVADADNHTIRRLTAAGSVITVAGMAGVAGNVDGTGAAARFYDPYGIAVDSAGTLYVGDSRNAIVRKGSPTPALPAFGIQPAGQVVNAGANAVFMAWALGIPTPNYQWQISADGGTTWADLTETPPHSGVTTRTLTVTAVTGLIHGARYRVRASNTAGAVASSAATLEVLFAPIFILQPLGHTVPAGTTTTFSAAAIANPGPIAYQWQVSMDAGSSWTSITEAWPYSGVTTGTLTIVNTPLLLDGYWYRVMAINSLGSSHSAAAGLAVTPVAPTFTTQPENQTVTAGYSATFSAAATGAPAPTYQWQTSGGPGGPWTPVANGPHYSGATTSTLTVVDATLSLDGSWYRNAATNTAGSATSVAAQLTVSAGYGPEMVQNGDFSAGASNWLLWEPPDVVWAVVGGVFRYHRAMPATTTGKTAAVFQRSGQPVAAGTALLAEFDVGNDDTVRKRISALVIDADWSDLSVCTFWLAPGAPMRTYQMRTHTTKAWANASIYFYVASDGLGDYLIDNVSLRTDMSGSAVETDCVDPTAPAAPGGSPSTNLLTNGDFSTGLLPPWGEYGDITWQIVNGVFEFFRPGVPGEPAGVILQQTGVALPANEILTATFDLGNSSAVRKRVTVLLHDAFTSPELTDLSACTFWLAPQQPLTTHAIRSFTTKAWVNATISIYAATKGTETWTRLDNVTLIRTPSTSIVGTECLEPGSTDPALATPGRTSVNAVGAAIASGRWVSGAGERTRNARLASVWRGDEDEWIAERFTRTSELSPAGDEPRWVAVASDGATHALTRLQPIDLTTASSAHLTFHSWLSSVASIARVEVSLDGITWERLHDVPASASWTIVDVDLAAYLGRIVTIRFVLDSMVIDPHASDEWRLAKMTFSRYEGQR